jgi:glycosyltransferase involved in cell wall biosynthesis
MREAKLFVLPSTEEGQGAVLVEAMASGTPCIGSDAGGIPTVITPETGLIFPAGNSKALAQAVSQLLEDDSFWQSASQKGRQRAQERYDWNALAEGIIAIYNQVK